MYCPNCGKDAGDSKFCPECGKSMDMIPASETKTEVKKSKTPNGKKKIVIFALLLIVALIGVCVFVVPKLGSKEASEINFSQLRRDYDSNSVAADETYNGNTFIFYIKVTSFNKNGELFGTIMDSKQSKFSFCNTISSWDNKAWANNGHMWWDWSWKTSSKTAKTMVAGETYKVKGTLKIKYNGSNTGVATFAKVTGIEIIE